METESARTRSAQFREVIAAFIAERRELKLKGMSEEAAAQAAAKYEYQTWLADAARRVDQIQAVTHVLKAIHPDARGSSLHVAPAALPQHDEVGSHALGALYDEDIVGNAAALDVYKFLKLEVDGRRLLDWLQGDDADLLAALHPDAATARDWAAAFNGLVRPAPALSSHALAKQVYWCVSDEPCDDAGFHLLQPLFPSSLVHVVHRDINDARFGETNKAARQARRDKVAHEITNREYLGLAQRKLGGTKPQNVSQLNSERGGVNYLLASLPPHWEHHRPRLLLGVESALPRFRYDEGVPELIDALIALLQSEPNPTMETRQRRERIERALGEALAAFGLAKREQFQPGWTRAADCRLPLCEQLWLDPDRVELPPRPDHEEIDREFVRQFELKDWPDQVAHRFGNWLNAILLDRDLPVGDDEHAHWARQAIIAADWPATMARRASEQGGGKHV